jgi:2,4-dienoyl-CoA reductase-like NADH-dependent reductase (Old Yellow Enzyme family)
MSALFTPGRIGSMEVRNRIVMPAMTTRLANEDGTVSDATIAYFTARAAGGVGLVTVEMASPERVGRHRFRELGIYDDRFLPGLQRLTDSLHAQGAKASIQLGHAGGHTREDICGETPIAPWALPHYVFEVTGATVTPLMMTRERIEQTVRAFVAAAVRARAAGFDCVEVHAAHGYLLSQFLCPAENRRRDEYGRSIENRARLTLHILQRIKTELRDFPVILRLNANDYFPGGLRFGDSLKVAKWAVNYGVDALHVTAGHYRSLPSAHMMTPPMNCAEGIFLDYAAHIKAEVSVPVIAVGRLGDPALAMRAVDGGQADFVALGRPLIADPDWVAKAQSGTAVRRCLSCNGCVDGMRGGDQLRCVVNPTAARELEYAHVAPAASGERIAVIGAGPAGLSYAALAAGSNEVTVFEKAARTGGALRYAGLAPRFQNVEARQDALDAFIASLERTCTEKDVRFELGTEIADASELPKRGFDRVIVATGARYRHGLGPLVHYSLAHGWARSALCRRLFDSARIKDWWYYRGREPALPKLGKLSGDKVQVIGDAAVPGKTREAIESAFNAALRVPPRSPPP